MIVKLPKNNFGITQSEIDLGDPLKIIEDTRSIGTKVYLFGSISLKGMLWDASLVVYGADDMKLELRSGKYKMVFKEVTNV